MRDRIYKTIIGFGLLVVICLCIFLFFQENKGCADERFAPDLKSSDCQGEALLQMFEIGLEKSRNNNSTENPEYYYGMVEVAIQQSSQHPEFIEKFWEIFEKHLNGITVTPLARIEILGLFKQQVELCASHCKNIEQYKKIWETSEKIDSYRTKLINSEIENGLNLLENNNTEIVKILKQENNANTDLLLAYNFITNYSSESREELQNRFNDLIKSAGEQIVSKIKEQVEEFKNRFNTIKESCPKERINPVITDNSIKGKIEYGIGVSHQLLLDIQDFIGKDLNANILQSLTSISPSEIIELQTNTANLLEKTRVLNQIRYNLWAKNIINDAGSVLQFDGMSMISVDFLYPVVALYYNDKMSETIKKFKDPNIISYNVTQMILKDKAPLSAF